jgi:hypothetical protein
VASVNLTTVSAQDDDRINANKHTMTVQRPDIMCLRNRKYYKCNKWNDDDDDEEKNPEKTR